MSLTNATLKPSLTHFLQRHVQNRCSAWQQSMMFCCQLLWSTNGPKCQNCSWWWCWEMCFWLTTRLHADLMWIGPKDQQKNKKTWLKFHVHAKKFLCTALKTAGLLSCLQMKITSSEWTKTECGIWERLGSKSLGAILSLLRQMMFLREESACLSQTCCSIVCDHRCNDSSCCAKQNKTSWACFAIVSSDNLCFVWMTVSHCPWWCVRCSPEQTFLLAVSNEAIISLFCDTEELQFPDASPTWGCSVLCHVLGIGSVSIEIDTLAASKCLFHRSDQTTEAWNANWKPFMFFFGTFKNHLVNSLQNAFSAHQGMNVAGVWHTAPIPETMCINNAKVVIWNKMSLCNKGGLLLSLEQCWSPHSCPMTTFVQRW